MQQSRPLYVGMDVHTDASAVAYVAQAHGAASLSLGTIGTRQYDLDNLIRTLPSKATPLVFVYDAGRCGSWLYRDLRKNGPTPVTRRMGSNRAAKAGMPPTRAQGRNTPRTSDRASPGSNLPGRLGR
jgi:hypothetical protein